MATFAACNINLAGTYTLTASDGALTTIESTSLTITVGPAAKVGFTTQPAGAVSAIAFTTQPVAKIQDAGGNTIVGSSATVNLTLTTPGLATLACTTNPQGAVAGVASFAGCKIDVANTYTLTATATGLTPGVSASLIVTAGAAAKVAFTTAPSGSTGGVAFATQPVVKVQDLAGNTVTTDTSSVTLSIPAGVPALTCTSANPLPAVAGVATFTGCKIDVAGTYTLTATDSGLTVGDRELDDHGRRGRGEGCVHDVAEWFDWRCRVRDAAGREGAGRRWQHGDDRHQFGDAVDSGGSSGVDVHECEPVARGGRCGHVHRLQDRRRRHVHAHCGGHGSDLGDRELDDHGRCGREGCVHDVAEWFDWRCRVRDAAGREGAGRRWEHGDDRHQFGDAVDSRRSAEPDVHERDAVARSGRRGARSPVARSTLPGRTH